ncbi:MAG TPA: peptide-methionine (R)-S-oxide reductase MsrB [Steroidobacteraceae bacterium]|jgi:peptide-methionine (R)-S-oxide reductase
MSVDCQDRHLTRRQMLLRSLALAGTTTCGMTLLQRSVALAADAATEVQIEAFTPGGQSRGVSSLPKIVRSDAEWRQVLTPLSFDVTRHAGTERAFSGALWNQHADGLYACICCQTTLFDSRTKFESGTGWPSFWQPISKYNVADSSDNSLFMQRTAVSCRRCDAHLGHVFDDGPKPTGLRYCMNSVALQFAARA